MPRKGHRKASLTGFVRAVPIENCSNETGMGNTLVSTVQACKTRYSVNMEQRQCGIVVTRQLYPSYKI